ncbi:MAG: hypothetical protein IT495_10095 [Gammaproteobacteria bacterium]|nr:hypothetical protein [Gammaproteobacteria bacterium]
MTGPGSVLLVGSVPLSSVAEVMSTCAERLGDTCRRLPDGEAGGWVNLPAATLGRAHGLELVASRIFPGTTHEVRTWRMQPGTPPDDIRYAPTGYIDTARSSYAEFVKLLAAGRVAAGTRFQVSLPTAYATIAMSLVAEEVVAALPGYERLVLGEVDAICALIPHAQLALQWDVALEVIDVLENQKPVVATQLGADGVAEALARACNRVPADVEVGVHLCYGNPGGKHLIEPADLGKLVHLSNRLFARLARPLTWLHMPVPIARDDDAYFAPLDRLALPAGTELFLGLIHPGDGIEGARRRITAARRHVAGFGVATECGMRFFPPAIIGELLTLQREAAALVGV